MNRYKKSLQDDSSVSAFDKTWLEDYILHFASVSVKWLQ